MLPEPDARPRAGEARNRLVLVTGPSGAGRSTAIRALEDMGYEAIDNMPLSLLPRLLEGPQSDKPLALGIDARNRDFSTNALAGMIDQSDWHPAVLGNPQAAPAGPGRECRDRNHARIRSACGRARAR